MEGSSSSGSSSSSSTSKRARSGPSNDGGRKRSKRRVGLGLRPTTAAATQAPWSAPAALTSGGAGTLSSLVHSGEAFSSDLRALIGSGTKISAANRQSLVGIMSTVSAALHDDFAREHQQRESERAELAVAEPAPLAGPLGTLPEFALLHVFSFSDARDLSAMHCVHAFRSEEGLALLEKTCTELHARAYPTRSPLGVSPAWQVS